MSGFRDDLLTLLRGRFPLIQVVTWEEDRLVDEIKSICADATAIRNPREVFVWTQTQGMASEHNEYDENSKEPQAALNVIKDFNRPAVFVFKDLHPFISDSRWQPDFNVIRRIRDILPVIKRNPNPINIILVSPQFSLPDELQKDTSVLNYDLPTKDEMLALLNRIIESNRTGTINIDLDEDEKVRLAEATLGLTLVEAENAFARSMVDDGSLDISDIETILEEKRQAIRKSGVLQLVDANVTMADVGGLQNLKDWLRKRDGAWHGRAERYGLPAPKGVLLTGIPGCGKSLIAKALANEWHLPMLRLDMGSVFQGLVGASESNMRRAIQVAEAISPSILWIDEVEKGFAGTNSQNDTGVAARVFGTFLTWMQEKEKPVFVVATANDIEMLPAELMRKGRFDEIFFVDLPTTQERREIFKVHLERRLQDAGVRGDFIIDESAIANLAEKTKGSIGAEIEMMVIAGLFDAFSEDRSIAMGDFETAISSTVLLSVTQAEQIQALREWAKVRAVSATPREKGEQSPVRQPTDPWKAYS